MDSLFAELLTRNTPQVNKLVMKGLACTYMKNTEEYIDKVFRSASRSFPLNVKYIGYEKCTPEEEYDILTQVKTNKRNIDLAKSDIYLIKYLFEFNGKPLPPRYIYLPYVNDAGIFSLGGAKFHVTPVLSDKVISPGSDHVFIRLLRDKMIFKRCYHSIVKNGNRETMNIVWSQIYRRSKDKKVNTATRAVSSIAHYLFAKFGFTETFKRFAGFVPVIGEEDINTSSYPSDKWIICESSQIKPKSYLSNFYEPTNIKLAIPKNKWNNVTSSLVVGFYYVVDHFPSRFKTNSLDNTNIWKIILGFIIFGGQYGENKLFTNIMEHFVSLDDYIDNIIIDKLAETDTNIIDFYDLLILILSNFNNLILDNETNSLSVYGKNLEIIYYMLYDITTSIFRINFRLSKLIGKRIIEERDIIEIFNKNLKMGAVFGLASGKIITESVSYSGDHMFIKIASKMTEQENMVGSTRGSRKRLIVNDTQHIDFSKVEAGSCLYLSKTSPIPTNRINPYINFDALTGTIAMNPKFNNLRTVFKTKLKI